MKRNFKTLGLVLAAVFAMSALGASAASAAEFHVASSPATLTGAQTTSHVLTTNAGTVTCKTATFSGQTVNKTSTSLALWPNYDNCTAFGFIGVPIHENGCFYELYAKGTAELKCPSGKVVEITAPGCTTYIGPQHIASGVTYSNNSARADVIGTTVIKGEIDYNECGTARTNGSYSGSTTLTASASIWYE